MLYNTGLALISLGISNVAVKRPVMRKIITAVIDRTESLGSPHSPWPLVQPEANWVPTPTKNPATINWVFVPKVEVSKGK